MNVDNPFLTILKIQHYNPLFIFPKIHANFLGIGKPSHIDLHMGINREPSGYYGRYHSSPLLQKVRVVQHRLHLVDVVVSEPVMTRIYKIRIMFASFNPDPISANGFKPAIAPESR